MLRTFTASTDFTGKGNTIRRLFPSKGTGAQTVNVRANGASGAIQLQVQLPATSSNELDFSSPPLQIAGAVYVEVVGTGFAQGAIDLSRGLRSSAWRADRKVEAAGAAVPSCRAAVSQRAPWPTRALRRDGPFRRL